RPAANGGWLITGDQDQRGPVLRPGREGVVADNEGRSRPVSKRRMALIHGKPPGSSLGRLTGRRESQLTYRFVSECPHQASRLALSSSRTSSTIQSSYAALKLSPCDFTNSVQASSASWRVG